MDANNPENVRYLTMFRMLVDRFHSINHAQHDEICKDYCSPHDPDTPGMVSVVSRVQVPGPGDDSSLLTGHGKTIYVDINIGNIGAPERLVKRRRLRKKEKVGDGPFQLQVWFEYVLEDHGNTEVAEQTFSKLLKYKGVMRNMRMWHALFFLTIMVEHLNHDTHCGLVRSGKNPTGEDEAAFESKNRKSSAYTNMHFRGLRG